MEQNEIEREIEAQEPIESEERVEIDLAKELEMERAQRIATENKLYCIQLLEKNALPRELCDYLTANNEEETQKLQNSINIIKTNINSVM